MKLPALLLLASACWLFAAPPTAVTIIDEKLTTSSSLDGWTKTSKQEGRIQIAPNPGKPSSYLMVLDDRTDNAVFSKNVASRTVLMDDYESLTVAFDFHRFNDELHGSALTSADPNSAFDGIVLRTETRDVIIPISELEDGRNTLSFSTWFTNAEIAGLESFTIELHQYDNFASPNDGVGWGDFLVTGIRRLEILPEPPYVLSESQASFTLPVVLSPPPLEDTVIYLQHAEGGISHGSAIYPRGQAVVYLTFPGFDDNRLDGDEWIALYLTDGFRDSSPFEITIKDDELAGLALAIPQTVPENGGDKIGTVAISGVFTNALQVHLTSSHPDLVSVPSSVWIYPGYSILGLIPGDASFSITPRTDARIIGDQQVTITASIGGETISETLVFLEGNSLAPIVSGPDEIIEGQHGVPLMVGINGISDTPTVVTLVSSLPEVSLSQSAVTVPAGVSQVQVMLSSADDNIAVSNKGLTVTATVQGVGSFALPLQLIDNDLSRFSVNLPTLIEKGVNFPTVITAENLDGSRLMGFSRTADVLLEDVAGQRTTLLSGVLFTDGQASVGLNFPVSIDGKYVIIRDSTGLETRFGPLHYFQRLAFAANSIIYDKTRDRILAISGGSALPGFIHSLTAINPSTGAFGTPLFLGNDPVNMDITDDGQFLYVGLRSANSVQRVTLGTFTKAEEIRLTALGSWGDYAYYPEQIMTLPGRPRDFIATQQAVTSSYSAVNPYFDGVVQTGNSHNSWSLALGRTPGQFYGFNYSNSGFDLVKAALNPSGFSTVVNSSGEISGYNTRIVAENDIIFTNTGKVVNGITMRAIGQISFPWSSTSYNSIPVTVETDLAKSRVFFGRGNEIVIYDSQAFTLIDRIVLPGIGNIKEIIRYRESGLACITDSGQLLLINERKFIPDGAPTDLKVTLTAAPEPVLLDGALTYSYSVKNTGTLTAEDVTVALNLSDGQTLQAGGSPRTSTAGGIKHFIGGLAAGAKVDLVTHVSPSRLTTLVATAVATSSTLDSNYQDNIASKVSNVGFNTTPNSINILELLIQDVKVNPANGSLVVAVDADAPQGMANSIMVMDPANGLISKTIPLPGEPIQLAISGDGTVAYALGVGRNLMYRVDLANGTFSKTLSFGDLDIDDFEVITGTTDSIILGSGWDGVQIFDNGVLRPNTSGTYRGDQVELLPASDLAFAYNTEHSGFESFKLQISSTGVSILSETSSLFSGYTNNIRSDGYYIYSPGGAVVRADLMTKTGNFDLSGVFNSDYYYYISPSVEPERAKRRAYFAALKQIQSFDTETYLKVRNVTYPTLPASFSSIERWGNDGFVSKLANQHLVIIRTDLVPDQAGALDLIVNTKDGDVFGQSQLTVTGKAFAGQGVQSVTVNGFAAISLDAFANWSIALTLIPGENELLVVGTPFGGGPAEERRITVHYHTQLETMALALLDTKTLAPGWRNLDSDGDGHSDLAEVFFGMDPTKADQPMHVKSMGDWKGPSDMLCYRRMKAMRDSYLPATSRELTNWDHTTPLLTYHGTPITCVTDDRYEDVFFTLDTEGEPRLFFNVLIRE